MCYVGLTGLCLMQRLFLADCQADTVLFLQGVCDRLPQKEAAAPERGPRVRASRTLRVYFECLHLFVSTTHELTPPSSGRKLEEKARKQRLEDRAKAGPQFFLLLSFTACVLTALKQKRRCINFHCPLVSTPLTAKDIAPSTPSRRCPRCLSRGCRAAAQRRADLRERLQLDRYATPPPSDGEAPAAGAPAPARVSEYAAGELRTTVTVAPISLYRRAPWGLRLQPVEWCRLRRKPV